MLTLACFYILQSRSEGWSYRGAGSGGTGGRLLCGDWFTDNWGGQHGERTTEKHHPTQIMGVTLSGNSHTVHSASLSHYSGETGRINCYLLSCCYYEYVSGVCSVCAGVVCSLAVMGRQRMTGALLLSRCC